MGSKFSPRTVERKEVDTMTDQEALFQLLSEEGLLVGGTIVEHTPNGLVYGTISGSDVGESGSLSIEWNDGSCRVALFHQLHWLLSVISGVVFLQRVLRNPMGCNLPPKEMNLYTLIPPQQESVSEHESIFETPRRRPPPSDALIRLGRWDRRRR